MAHAPPPPPPRGRPRIAADLSLWDGAVLNGQPCYVDVDGQGCPLEYLKGTIVYVRVRYKALSWRLLPHQYYFASPRNVTFVDGSTPKQRWEERTQRQEWEEQRAVKRIRLLDQLDSGDRAPVVLNGTLLPAPAFLPFFGCFSVAELGMLLTVSKGWRAAIVAAVSRLEALSWTHASGRLSVPGEGDTLLRGCTLFAKHCRRLLSYREEGGTVPLNEAWRLRILRQNAPNLRVCQLANASKAAVEALAEAAQLTELSIPLGAVPEATIALLARSCRRLTTVSVGSMDVGALLREMSAPSSSSSSSSSASSRPEKEEGAADGDSDSGACFLPLRYLCTRSRLPVSALPSLPSFTRLCRLEAAFDGDRRDWHQLAQTLAALPSLSSLALSTTRFVAGAAEDEDARAELPFLRDLSLPGCVMFAFSGRRVRRLRCSDVYRGRLQPLLSAFPRLLVLDLGRRAEGITDEDLVATANAIETAAASSSSFSSSSNDLRFAWSELRELRMDGLITANVSLWALLPLLRCCRTRLEVLRLGGLAGSFKAIRAALAAVSNIRSMHLDMKGYRGTADEEEAERTGLEALERVAAAMLDPEWRPGMSVEGYEEEEEEEDKEEEHEQQSPLTLPHLSSFHLHGPSAVVQDRSSYRSIEEPRHFGEPEALFSGLALPALTALSLSHLEGDFDLTPLLASAAAGLDSLTLSACYGVDVQGELPQLPLATLVAVQDCPLLDRDTVRSMCKHEPASFTFVDSNKYYTRD